MTRLAALEGLAGELADQRLCLVEECVRFTRIKDRWESERQAVAIDLEQLGSQLQATAAGLAEREQALERAESALQQRIVGLEEAQKHFQGWKALLLARLSGWEAVREHTLAELGSRERFALEQLAALNNLHQRWQERRRWPSPAPTRGWCG